MWQQWQPLTICICPRVELCIRSGGPCQTTVSLRPLKHDAWVVPHLRYVGSMRGDSQLVRLSATPVTEEGAPSAGPPSFIEASRAPKFIQNVVL